MQLLVVVLVFSCCTNSASTNNYSPLHHVGRCIMTADSLWMLWRRTYDESSEDKGNNSRIFLSEGYLPCIICDGLRAPLTGKLKIQIRCKIVSIRERIIFWSNSVRPLVWITVVVSNVHICSRFRAVETQLSGCYDHLWNGRFHSARARDPPLTCTLPPTSPSRQLWQPWDSNEGGQALACSLPTAHPPLISSMTQDKRTSAR